MGNCIYCGKSAGFLRRKHRECSIQNTHGVNQATDLINKTIFNSEQLSLLDESFKQISQTHYLLPKQVKELLVSQWESAVNKALDDGILTEAEETHLIKFKEYFALTQNEINKHDGLSRLTKAAILRDILDGKIPERVTIADGIPFNLLKDEKLIWVFAGTEFYEDRVVREYSGRSGSFSIRLAKGVYYRTSAFKSSPITRTERTYIDRGAFGITNKHIYFVGASKSFRVKINKIISLIPYDDGIGIQKDGVTAKPQTFITGDGWFTYNALANLSQL